MSAHYLLAAATQIDLQGLIWTPREVRDHLVMLADKLDPPDMEDLQFRERIPLTGPHLAEAMGRLLFRAEVPTTDYSRCVQVSQMLGDSANRLDVKEDFARANMLREYAHAVSVAGGAL
jgi:hypothetical protein